MSQRVLEAAEMHPRFTQVRGPRVAEQREGLLWQGDEVAPFRLRGKDLQDCPRLREGAETARSASFNYGVQATAASVRSSLAPAFIRA